MQGILTMINFKEKVRKEAANILESKEELNEADLKEWFWTSTEKEERIKDAAGRAKSIELLMHKLESINLRASSILHNKKYFSAKEFDSNVQEAFHRDIKILSEKFDEARSTLASIISEANRQLKNELQTRKK